MLNPEQIQIIKNQAEILEGQFELCAEKIAGVAVIEPKGNSAEQERARLIKFINDQKPKIKDVLKLVEGTLAQAGLSSKMELQHLNGLGLLFTTMKQEIAQIVEEQYEAKLDMYRQEIFKSIDIILDPIDMLVPAIRHEILHLEKFYSRSSNSEISILPELRSIVEKVEDREISIQEFLNGYTEDKEEIPGYNELRTRNNQFSSYQFYENSPEAYWPINTKYQQICKTIEPLLNERKTEPELEKFLHRVRDKDFSIIKMNDIFEADAFLNDLVKKTGKKYCYRKAVKTIVSMLTEFENIQKELIAYNDEKIAEKEKALYANASNDAEKNRLKIILDETREFIANRQISFSRLEMIFERLEAKNYNIVVKEKEEDDITIIITPHHERKFGRDILERINLIIQEIDFWYPDETKENLFQNLSKITKKIQEDEPIDKNEFLTLMKKYDKEIETNIRKTYPEKARELNNVLITFQKTFGGKMDRQRLERRLENKEIWNFIQPLLKSVSSNLSILSSGNASLKKNVNKFTFLKAASEELNQLLYDLGMQTFILFDGVEGKSVTNMTNILSTYNKFHDINALWGAFSYYIKKTALPNVAVNESVILQMTQNPHCKTYLSKMFSGS